MRGVKRRLPHLPVLGRPVYDALHGVKRGVKDLISPQGMFEDLGLKYLGPVDGHDRAALENAFALARHFDGPVIVHTVTRKGYGYAPAENDELDQMHGPGAFDPVTGAVLPKSGRKWTGVFADQILQIGARRPDVVAISAAMCEPVGLARFAEAYPDRFYDVGIAEQHALTSAAGLASGGLHPVIALYATFLNRAFDQLLMDVALHRLPVTVVLDRAGVTGDDGPSHNGMWDMAILGVVPGLALAAPRDEPTLREELDEAVACSTGPTVVRYPKTPMGADVPALRRIGPTDVLAEPHTGDVDVLLVAVGATAADVLEAAAQVRQAGYSVRVIDPRWVTPVDPSVLELARTSRLVVTVEDGVVAGGVGSRVSQALRSAGIDVPTRDLGIPVQFLDHGKVADVRARIALTTQDVARQVVGVAAHVLGDEDASRTEHGQDAPSVRHAEHDER